MKSELMELSFFFEISQALHKSHELKEVIQPVLKILAERMGMQRGILTLFNRENEESVIQEAYGLTKEEQQRGRYQPGEGIIGKVLTSGEPVIVPLISEEPQFLNKTRSRKDHLLSFICVPIKIGNEVIGTLSVDRVYDPVHSLNEDMRLLSVIASMIAQAVKVHQKNLENIQTLQEENHRLQNLLNQNIRPENIVGNSKKMHIVYGLIQEVATTPTTVLILGESGVGKELIAHAIHYLSHRKHKPFIRVNCSAIPDHLLEAELFGYEKGSFTGAYTSRKGKFEAGHEGTIFLDEIGDFSLNLQLKLLRVLQEKEFYRIGSNTPIKTDVRIITATNRNLEELIKEKKIREDFYYRIHVFPVSVPPLRERKTDIPLLADHFVEKFSNVLGKTIRRISTPAIDMLMSYHWPGNVRELENCIERASILTKDEVIHSYNLPPTLQIAESRETKSNLGLQQQLDNLEKELIFDALKIFQGNMRHAARLLGITERQMGSRVRKYKIHPKHFFKSRKNNP